LFIEGSLTDALRNMSSDPYTEQKVKKKLLKVLASWHSQYKNDLSMKTVANLYKQHRNDTDSSLRSDARAARDEEIEVAKQKAKDDARRKEKEEADRLKREKDAKKKRADQGKSKSKRKPFDFEQEKPKILTQIASATQSANNLVNAITLVNREHETLQENARVQECLAMLKQERKPIVRYIQLVENEDMIGTLIETNDRIVAALDMYDTAISKSAGVQGEVEVENIQKGLASTKIEESELAKLQEKQRAAVDRATRGRNDREGGTQVHPDLQDLSFGPLGEDRDVLPPPLKPNTRNTSSDEDYGRRTLSDFSDYESSDEEAHKKNVRNAASSSNNYSGRRVYPGASDLDITTGKGLLDDNPFADPFGDSHGVDVSSSVQGGGRQVRL